MTMLTYKTLTEALNTRTKMHPSEGFFYNGANKRHVELGELPYYVETFEIEDADEMYDFVMAIIGYALMDVQGNGWDADDIKEASYELYAIATSDDDDDDDEYDDDEYDSLDD